MIKKYVQLYDGNMELLYVLDCDNRHCLNTCLKNAAKRILKVEDKRIQFMQIAMGRDGLTAKPVLRPVRV